MKNNNSKMLVDPPEGWKFGFPKYLPQEHVESTFNMNKWLIQNGYPQKLIDEYGKFFYVRMISTDYEYAQNDIDIS